MKQLVYGALLIGICALLALGFQCSSAELTSAKLYYQRQDWDNAEKSAEKEVQKNPQSGEGWFMLGDIRAQKKNYEGMVEAWDKCSKATKNFDSQIKERKYYYWAQSFNSAVSSFNKGRTTNDTVAYNNAIRDFKLATLIQPDSVAGYKDAVFAYLSEIKVYGDLLDSLKLKKASQDEVSRIEASRDQARKGSIENLEKMKTVVPKDPDSYYYLGRLYYEKGQALRDSFEVRNKDIIDMVGKLERITPGYYKQDVRAVLGEPNKIIGGETSKKPSKKGAKPQQPTTEEWLYQKYNLHLTFDGNVLKTKKVDPPYRPNIDSTLFYKASGEFEKAIEELVEANRLDPSSEEIMTYLSNSFIGANKAAEAMEVFRKSVETSPRNKAFRYNYGVLLLKAAEADTNCAMVDRNYGAALDQFDAAVTLDSVYENALYNLAVGYVNWGVRMRECSSKSGKEGDESFKAKFKQAQPYLERLLALKPTDPFMWDTLGKVYMNLNMKEKAEQAFKKADELRK
jgi:tetratricopeptide (TPR) repeat protein